MEVDVGVWLHGLGLQRYEPVFRESEIDAAVLPKLRDEHLKELGLPLGARLKLLEAIAKLHGEAAASSTPPEPTIAVATRPVAGAERRQLTVMFVDLVGSTALSADLDPEEMREVLRAYQNAVAGEVARFEGHIAKFMGDGVLAYFGWPRAHEDEAERAVRAGLAIAEAVGRLETPAARPLAARVGIATGLVVVGDLVGEGAAQEEAVVGETPNLAARLQAQAATRAGDRRRKHAAADRRVVRGRGSRPFRPPGLRPARAGVPGPGAGARRGALRGPARRGPHAARRPRAGTRSAP